MRGQDVIAIPLGGCRLFVAFRSAKGFPGMNTTFRGAKGDYVLELTNGEEKGSQRTNPGSRRRAVWRAAFDAVRGDPVVTSRKCETCSRATSDDLRHRCK
jgi:hypothetical protein